MVCLFVYNEFSPHIWAWQRRKKAREEEEAGCAPAADRRYWTSFIEYNQFDFFKISVLSFLFLCLLVGLCVCMFVTNLVPRYMGIAEEEEGKRGGGGWPCARRHSWIAIFHLGIVMSFWGLIILAPPPPAIKGLPVDGFWCSGYQNDHLD